jgi:hypothetical protein
MHYLRISAIAVILTISFNSFPARAEVKKRIAILDFFADNTENSRALAVRSRVESALFKLKQDIHVIERRSMEKDAPVREGDAPCRDTACAVKRGRMVSADYVIIGGITYAFRYTITVRIIDVSNGRITYEDSVALDDKNDILRLSDRLADILAKFLGDQVNRAPVVNPEKKKNTPDLNFSAGYVLPVGYLQSKAKKGYSISISGGVVMNDFFVGAKVGFIHLFGAGINSYAYAVPVLASFRYDFFIKNFYLSPGISFGTSVNIISGSKRSSLQLMGNPGFSAGYRIDTVRIFSSADYYCIYEKKRGIQYFSFGIGCGMSI